MSFNLINKNVVTAFITLACIIILSNHHYFNFCINTPLGRLVLILFILGITSINAIFGIVLVFFIIIFNQNNFIYTEGFTDSSNNLVNNIQNKKNEVIQTIQNKMANQTATTTSSSASTTPPPVTTTTETFGGREGFQMIDRESVMLKGKRSNEIPVFSNARNQQDNVEPTDKSIFMNDYASV
jgi:hypothetical protein